MKDRISIDRLLRDTLLEPLANVLPTQIVIDIDQECRIVLVDQSVDEITFEDVIVSQVVGNLDVVLSVADHIPVLFPIAIVRVGGVVKGGRGVEEGCGQEECALDIPGVCVLGARGVISARDLVQAIEHVVGDEDVRGQHFIRRLVGVRVVACEVQWRDFERR